MQRYGRTFDLTDPRVLPEGRSGAVREGGVAADLRAAAVRAGGSADPNKLTLGQTWIHNRDGVVSMKPTGALAVIRVSQARCADIQIGTSADC
jgi:hypothetical protein